MAVELYYIYNRWTTGGNRSSDQNPWLLSFTGEYSKPSDTLPPGGAGPDRETIHDEQKVRDMQWKRSKSQFLFAERSLLVAFLSTSKIDVGFPTLSFKGSPASMVLDCLVTQNSDPRRVILLHSFAFHSLTAPKTNLGCWRVIWGKETLTLCHRDYRLKNSLLGFLSFINQDFIGPPGSTVSFSRFLTSQEIPGEGWIYLSDRRILGGSFHITSRLCGTLWCPRCLFCSNLGSSAGRLAERERGSWFFWWNFISRT